MKEKKKQEEIEESEEIATILSQPRSQGLEEMSFLSKLEALKA